MEGAGGGTADDEGDDDINRSTPTSGLWYCLSATRARGGVDAGFFLRRES